MIGIKAPKAVNGFPQDPIDGVSMAASFNDAKAPENKHVQYFDNNGSDGIYQDGWYACTFGPLSPWLNAQPGLDKWDSSEGRVGTLRSHQGLLADARPRQGACRRSSRK